MKAPIRIVLADDDQDDRDIFQEALLETAIATELITVENGQKLIDIIKASEPPAVDIIFIDINMPAKNGIECLKEIRRDKNHKETLCIVLTTSSSKEIVDKAYKAGANLFLTKPASYNSYSKIITHVLSAYSDTQPPFTGFLGAFSSKSIL